MKKKQYLQLSGIVQIFLTTRRGINSAQENPIIVVHTGKMMAVGIISQMSICQKLSKIYLCKYF